MGIFLDILVCVEGFTQNFTAGNRKIDLFCGIRKVRNSITQNLKESIEIIMATGAGDLQQARA